jgi:hypothetical protein
MWPIEPDEANADMDIRMARRFAEQWYAAWNAHDLDAILDHYTDDVELVSPLASELAASADGRVVGKDALRAYFASGLARFPTMSIQPIDLLVGVESLVLRYIGPTGVETAEVVFLNVEGKVSRYFAHYAAPRGAGRIPGQDP